jgi:branched-chain amino acid transport system permease protein
MLPSGVLTTKYESDLAVLRTRTQWLLLAVAIGLLFSLALFASDYWLLWLTRVAIYVVAVLGLHILTGLCGQFSIGHMAFLGVGAYVVAVITNNTGLSGWLCLPISGLAAGLVGLFFGLPCFRLKGFYLAISTLAASFIIVWLMEHFEWQNAEGLTVGGSLGLAMPRLTLAGADFTSKGAFYCVTIAVMLAATLFAKNIQRTRTGRAFVAIRDNELAAEISGISLFRYKMLAFFIGCFYAGIAGWLWAYSLRSVNPLQFGLDDSIWLVGMLIIGGMGSTTGVFLGAVSFRLLEEFIDYIRPMLEDAFPAVSLQLNVALSLGVFSVVLLVFLILEPRGLYSRWEKFKTYYRLYPYAYMRE